MSDEFQIIVSVVTSLVSIGILALGLYRLVLMSRGFVDPVFRSKARWSAALLGIVILSNVENFIPTSTNALLSVIETLPFLGVLVCVFAFVDRTIIVAGRMDFFHRDTLSWSRFRIPVTVAVAAAILLILPSSSYPEAATTPGWIVGAVYFGLGIIVVVFGYGAVALVASARRSSDRTLRRHILLLGISLGMFASDLALFILPTNDASVLLTNSISVLSLVVLYFAVMTLTPLGRMRREDNQA